MPGKNLVFSVIHWLLVNSNGGDVNGQREPSVDPAQARYFLAVADEGHFTRAAERIGVSQQTVSASIGRLEQNLGVVLLERTPRSVTLTDRGAQLVPLMRALVESSDRLDRAVRALAARPGASLRIAYTETAGHEVVPAVLDRLRARWPELEAEAHEVWATELAAGLRDRRTELGFGRCIGQSEGLLTAPVRNDHLALVVLAEHRLAARSSVVLEDLKGERLVMFPRELAPGLHDAILTAVRSRGVQVDVVPSRMLGGGGLKARLRAANGVELCARSGARAPDGLAIIPVDSPTMLPVEIAWPTRAPESTRTVVAFVRSVAADEGWTDPSARVTPR